MKTSVNLMSQKALARECYHTRLRQWSQFLLLAVLAIGLHAVVTWWPVRNYSLQVEALEAQYEPIRQFKAKIGKLNRQKVATKTGHELELALSEDAPMMPLVGAIGQAAADSNGSVFLEQLDYRQGGAIDKEPTHTVSLVGLGTDTRAVSALAHRLRKAMPFATVELRSAETIEINHQPMQSFRIECTL